jgi:phage shock protein A
MNLAKTLSIVVPILIGMTACPAPKEDVDEELKAIEDKITQMETKLADFKERIKAADADRGLRDQLSEDEALLKSRLERLRERVKQAEPSPPAF